MLSDVCWRRIVRSVGAAAAHKAQNHPGTSSEIVRLCWKHGIATHFSNIIGFLGQTPSGIREHVRVLKDLDPDVSSFYILTPCPGTEQYEDFLTSGLIFEKNLDRFDATTVTWTHGRMSGKEIEGLLFESYRDFHTKSKIARCGMAAIGRRETGASWALNFALPAFSRYSAFNRRHPMSAGIARVIRDHESEYRDLRRSCYGLDRVPLPRSFGFPRPMKP